MFVEDLQSAENMIIRKVQHQAFSEEINDLMHINSDHSFRKLDPFIGTDGLLRVGGSLRFAEIPDESKRPILLPKDSIILEIIIRQIHKQGQHFGHSYILSQLREKYWIVNTKSAARKLISKCIVCKRQRGWPREQMMADLPVDRLAIGEPPFTRMGIDCFDPIAMKLKRSRIKRYCVIFTCLTIRAVHIEIADSMDTDSLASGTMHR
ncbi:uncharacterized protein LOC102802808 [Saccoglossus kowalevskii]|uniref:Uncharacterized protein LOC102802808 n=1 Tax=Saccoglossus kowalevskii TaxID=10224 RepID=A0ABM0LZ20_SACKO|nr:PREDICTED: uncharacterized protein LOC102802808 [Saccoglossus kowalevskii]